MLFLETLFCYLLDWRVWLAYVLPDLLVYDRKAIPLAVNSSSLDEGRTSVAFIILHLIEYLHHITSTCQGKTLGIRVQGTCVSLGTYFFKVVGTIKDSDSNFSFCLVRLQKFFWILYFLAGYSVPGFGREALVVRAKEPGYISSTAW